METRNLTRTSGSQQQHSPPAMLKLYNLGDLGSMIKLDRNLQSVLAALQGNLSITFGQAGNVKEVHIIDKDGESIANSQNLAALGGSNRLAKEHLETSKKTGASLEKVTLVSKVLQQHGLDGEKIKVDASLKISELTRKIENLEENLIRFVTLDPDEDEEKYKETLCVCGRRVHEILMNELANLVITGVEAGRLENVLKQDGIPGSLYGKLTSFQLVDEDNDSACAVLFSKNKPLGNLSITTAEIMSGEVLPNMAEICHNVYEQAHTILRLLTTLKQPLHQANPGSEYDVELLRFKWILTPKKGIGKMMEEYSTMTKKEPQKRSFKDKDMTGPLGKALNFCDAYNIGYAMAMRGQMYGSTHEENYWPSLVRNETIRDWENTDESLNSKVSRLIRTDYQIGIDDLHVIAVEYALADAGLFGNRLERTVQIVSRDADWQPPTNRYNSMVVNCASDALVAIRLVLAAAVRFSAVDKTVDAAEVEASENAIIDPLWNDIVLIRDSADLLSLTRAFLRKETQSGNNPYCSGLKEHVLENMYTFTSEDVAGRIKRVRRLVMVDEVSKETIQKTVKMTNLRLPKDKSQKKGRKTGSIGGILTTDLSEGALAVLKQAEGMEFYDEFQEVAVRWLKTAFIGGPKLQVLGARMFVSNIDNLEIIMKEEGLLDEEVLD